MVSCLRLGPGEKAVMPGEKAVAPVPPRDPTGKTRIAGWSHVTVAVSLPASWTRPVASGQIGGRRSTVGGGWDRFRAEALLGGNT